MKHVIFLFSFILAFTPLEVKGQQDSVFKVHFLYGSKPGKGFKKDEKKWFGGLHGGHVSIEIGDYVYGFGPTGRYHLLAHQKKKHSHYSRRKLSAWISDTATNKHVTFVMPIDSINKVRMQTLLNSFVDDVPYDYAFLGMRCAASTAEVLGEFGYIPDRSNSGHVFKNFYPKKLRKRMFKLAKEKHWGIVRVKGRASRKWEKDPKRYR